MYPTPKRKKYYFYLNGDLHKKLRVSRGKDLLVAWNYPEHKKVSYNYTDVQKRKKKAWTTTEVGEIIHRTKVSILYVLIDGHIPPPQHSYSLETGRKKEYWWSEEDIMNLHGYYADVKHGRPRKDGEGGPFDMPTPRELRAVLNDEEILYVKNKNGEFVPTWRARD